MLAPTVLKIIIFGALALHSFAHARAAIALVGQAMGGLAEPTTGTWLLPRLDPAAGGAIALPFWVVAALGFALAALAFWGVGVPMGSWRQLAVGAALISTLGIALFFGTWPGSPNGFYSLLNTAVAVAMNLVIVGSLLWLRWPSEAAFGK